MSLSRTGWTASPRRARHVNKQPFRIIRKELRHATNASRTLLGVEP